MAAGLVRLSKTGKKYNHLNAVVSAEDFDIVNKYNWSADNHGHTFYAKCFINGKLTYMHSFLMGEKEIDHIDRDGLNNVRSNLRPVTRSQNMANKPKQKGVYSSKYKGVYFDKRRSKWISRLEFIGKKIYIGSFDTEFLAAESYNTKAKEMFGDFTELNIINK